MNLYAWPVAIPVLAALAAAFGSGLWLAARGLRETIRLARFHLGPVTAERAPLSLEEVRVLAEMQRRYRRQAPEPACLDQEAS